ncbi:hypothetical protein SCLCIDRAFT_693703 [Scleroderma citrinum Foug A]|uniref:Uncharacterized protein n=1 Tax=Scleroderma citrinum Foug A TaxID=1036808 RepID=A0A0C3D3M8_9AGAM|nr:hypothetical protein SCLCIDRAFT_693703 [Scleroderma citrinum Foug A]
MNWPRLSDSNESSSCIATDAYNPLWVSHWLVEGGGGPDLKQASWVIGYLHNRISVSHSELLGSMVSHLYSKIIGATYRGFFLRRYRRCKKYIRALTSPSSFEADFRLLLISARCSFA